MTETTCATLTERDPRRSEAREKVARGSTELMRTPAHALARLARHEGCGSTGGGRSAVGARQAAATTIMSIA